MTTTTQTTRIDGLDAPARQPETRDSQFRRLATHTAIAAVFCLIAGVPANATLDCDINDPVTNRGLPDRDADQVSDALDNCLTMANPNQIDSDNDGFGNLCDQDLNNDGSVNFLDLSIFESRFLTADPDADFNSDGAVNFADLVLFQDAFLGEPGPNGQCLSDPAYCAGPRDIGLDDFVVGDQDAEKVVVMRTSDPEVIWHARRIEAGLTTCNRAIDATVVLGNEPYNPDWSWHVEGPVSFHGSNVMAIVGCNQTAQEVENFVQATQCGLLSSPGAVFCQEWCPWYSRIVDTQIALPET